MQFRPVASAKILSATLHYSSVAFHILGLAFSYAKLALASTKSSYVNEIRITPSK